LYRRANDENQHLSAICIPGDPANRFGATIGTNSSARWQAALSGCLGGQRDEPLIDICVGLPF